MGLVLVADVEWLRVCVTKQLCNLDVCVWPRNDSPAVVLVFILTSSLVRFSRWVVNGRSMLMFRTWSKVTCPSLRKVFWPLTCSLWLLTMNWAAYYD